MKRLLPYLLILAAGLFIFSKNNNQTQISQDVQNLRELYGSGNPDHWPKAQLSEHVNQETFEDIGVLPKVEFPENNQYSKAKAQLGKLLFFEPRLSQSGQIACASCHDPELAWGDGKTRAFGHDRQTGKRNAMTILNVGYAEKLFWDGRAADLEEQSLGPIADAVEMNENHQLAVQKIARIKGYQEKFADVFGEEGVTLENIQKAIATFERTITSTKSRFDRFISGNKELLTDSEILGLHVFRTKANCISCHNTPYFSDNQFHNDGQTLWGSRHEDLGLYNQTKNLEDVGKFRTPTLREVIRTGPWMHHGHFPTMLDVIQFYNLGNPAPIQNKYKGIERDSLLPQTSPILRKLNLTDQEIQGLIDFLGTLSTKTRRVAPPQLPQ